MTAETETYMSSGINWTWYLTIEKPEFGARDVIILKHFRVHNGDEQPNDVIGEYHLIEDRQRIVCAVQLTNHDGYGIRIKAVANREYIFDYK